ncbi:MAG: hypothetical protein AB7F40_08685 [Victivallaceae bacterium]
MKKIIIPLLLAAFCARAEFSDTPAQKAARAEKLLRAKTVQIDTEFPYYQNRSADSIASEIEVNGLDGVYYFVLRAPAVRREIIDELQKRSIPVALMTLPAMVYLSESELDALLPTGWREWKMEFTGNAMDQYIFIGFNYPEYRTWYKPYLIRTLQDNNFDGFTFAEVMYPITDGPERNPPFYGDVSPNFKHDFMRATGSRSFPDFTHPDSPDYFKRNLDLYLKLVEYRVSVINDFYDDIINSPDGVRAAVPGIKVATWTLGINLPDGINKLRTWEGNDISAMISKVRPDIHFVQTHAPDWSNPALPPDYPLAYLPFFLEIQQTDPHVKIALQADLGSTEAARRDPEWCKKFYEAVRKAGVDTTTYYEFSLRWKVYNAAPELRAIESDGTTAKLRFDQRLGADSAAVITGRRIGGSTVLDARVDGNTLIVELDLPLVEGKLTSLDVSGICDDPQVRFGRDKGKTNVSDVKRSRALKVEPMR